MHQPISWRVQIKYGGNLWPTKCKYKIVYLNRYLVGYNLSMSLKCLAEKDLGHVKINFFL